MANLIMIYTAVLVLSLPSFIKYKHKGAAVAFGLMFCIALTYSILVELNVDVEGLAFFFTKIVRDWGIKYPDLLT